MQAQLAVRVSEDLNYKITNCARKFHLKRSDIIRMALEKFLGEIKADEKIKPYEKVKNLLGALDSGIDNLGEVPSEYLLKRNRVIKEIKLIPDHKLSEVYDFIHYFRMDLQKSEGDISRIMKFAGCWNDMPEKVYNDFLKEIKQRRKQAFSRRRSNEVCAD